MEYIDSGCLTDMLDQYETTPLSEAEIARVCLEVFIYLFIHPRMHAHTPMHIHMYVHMHIHAYIHPRTYIHEHAHITYDLFFFFLKVLKALEYVHAANRIHRDIKSDSIYAFIAVIIFVVAAVIIRSINRVPAKSRPKCCLACFSFAGNAFIR